MDPKFRIFPDPVSALLEAGAWLMGSAAQPDRDWSTDPPRDFDLCVEPQDSARVKSILEGWPPPIRLNKFGGQVFEFPECRIDIWFSTIGETIAVMNRAPKHPPAFEHWAYRKRGEIWVRFYLPLSGRDKVQAY